MRTALLENDEKGTEALHGLRASRLGSEGNLVGLAQEPDSTVHVAGIPGDIDLS